MNNEEYLKNLEVLSVYVNACVSHAIQGISKLPEHILKLEGMSSRANRILLNSICTGLEGNYLEIGSWKGSTFISALYNNQKVFGTSIDHHNEFKDGSPFKTSAEALDANCKKYLLNDEKYELITKDCFANDLKLDKTYLVYFYDGQHSYENQYKALTKFYHNLAPMFIFICDDYSIDRVEEGTQAAFRDLNIKVITEHKMWGHQATGGCSTTGFWNGFYIAVCVKKDAYPEHFKKVVPTHSFGGAE